LRYRGKNELGLSGSPHYNGTMSDNPLHILEWLTEMGADTPLADEPIDRFAESAAQKERAKPGVPQGSPMQAAPTDPKGSVQERVAALNLARKAPAPREPVAATLPDESVVKSARELAENADTLEALRAAMDGFTGCNLERTAKNLVFGDGNPAAGVMLIGEAPGRDEDLQGIPFVGKSGQLLDRMLAAIGLDRKKVYITNVIPWRPPGNRTPTTAEIEICRPFIERHMQLVNPELIVMIGASSAKMLLQTEDGILKLRGQWQKLKVGEREVEAMATLHPAYLLRQPAQKRLAWHDWLKIRARLEDGKS
jgi:DNA polymerase